MERQEEQQNAKSKPSRIKLAIIILSVLLVLSAGGLVARYVYLNFFAPAQTTAVVPDNLIGEVSGTLSGETESSDSGTQSTEPAESGSQAEATTDSSHNGNQTGNASSGPAADKPTAKVLELYQGKPGDNERFEVRNMFPGDTETKYFCVRAYHDADITLFFKSTVTEQTKALGDVLNIKVTHMETGKELCDAPFSEIDGREISEVLKKNAQGETTAYYRIDVSLDTSVGNDYQAAMLKADFEWFVKDGLTPPPTGDTASLTLWIVLALSSSLLIILMLLKRRKGEEQNG